jgi:hypothetical protein
MGITDLLQIGVNGYYRFTPNWSKSGCDDLLKIRTVGITDLPQIGITYLLQIGVNGYYRFTPNRSK